MIGRLEISKKSFYRYVFGDNDIKSIEEEIVQVPDSYC